MPEPIFLRIRDDFTPPSNDQVLIDLPTFPLSYLKITVRRQQPTANSELDLNDMLSFITRVAVLVRGVTIFDGTGLDAFVIGSLLYCRKLPFVKRPLTSTSSQHYACIYVPFSRKPLMPSSGIKQLNRGESYMLIRCGTVPANTSLEVVAVGWRTNEPDWCLKVTPYTRSVTATGPDDLILAPAGPILGFIFYEDNPKETVTTSILDEVRFLIGGTEDTFVSYDIENLLTDPMISTYTELYDMNLVHVENTASAYTQNAITLSEHPKAADYNRYFGILLDELYDPDAIIAVPPGADVRLRYNATRTGTLKVFTVEMFTIPEHAAAAA